VLSRYGLLRRLFLAGVNRFNVYRVEEGIIPERWPVFLRCEGDHNGPMTSLLHNWQDLERAVAGAFARGLPLATLLIVEYAAEPLPSGVFRKFASFKVGQSTFAHTCVHSDHWVAKSGKLGVATQAMYEEENRVVRENPYGAEVAKAFEIAGIDYGRLDFGLVEGRVQINEINQNPDLKFGETHPVPLRCESYRIFEQNYLTALRALDAAGRSQSAYATAMPQPAYSFGRS
jgi:hypothetical protein